jgi:exopolysaccharide biosynthesis predicted pyruvyltransferase EpsI
MDLKSKNIASLGHQISNIDREINLIIENDKSMSKIVFYNGSGQLGDLTVWADLDQPLKDFLIDHFKKQKEIVYGKISEELKRVAE